MDISVIIPVYNAEKYIMDCLKSVLVQRDIVMEILCVDDASTDSSPAILAQAMQMDNRIKMITLPDNRGQAYARNEGLRIAEGKFVYFLDSDDLLKEEDALKILCDEADRNKLDGVCFESEIEYETEELREILGGRKFIAEHLEEKVFDGREYFGRFIRTKGCSVTVWRQLWRREFLINNNLWFSEMTSPHEDLLFTFKAFLLANRLFYLSKILHCYRFRKNSCSSGVFTQKRFCAYVRIYTQSMDFLKTHEKRLLSKSNMEYSLRKYLGMIIAFLHKNYVGLIKDGVDVWGDMLLWMDEWEVFWGKNLLMRKYPMLERVFTPEEYKKITDAEHVVVYGGGRYSKDLQSMLEDFGVADYEIAVTRRNEKITREILEFAGYTERTVVIIAVSEKYRDELIAQTGKIGFDNTICLSN